MQFPVEENSKIKIVRSFAIIIIPILVCSIYISRNHIHDKIIVPNMHILIGFTVWFARCARVLLIFPMINYSRVEKLKSKKYEDDENEIITPYCCIYRYMCAIPVTTNT